MTPGPEPREAGIADGRPIVRFRGVTKTYDGRNLVVHPLDLDVNRGEFLTLLGPSGSGKTTTLMMLAGFEAPSDGHILLDERRVDRLPPFQRGIGVVFQNYALFPHMSVAENVAFPLSVRRRPAAEIRERVARALSMVRLDAFHDRRPSRLSGGQQQRVALARALVFDPKLVLLDEPLGALDKQLREQLQYELKSLHLELGVTMIYVTHDQSEALTMSDRIAVFNEGRIEQLDAPRELYESPRSLFVAGFIGENNRFPATVEQVEGDRVDARLPGGELIAGHGVSTLRVGDPCIAALRPEHLRVAPAEEGAAHGQVIDLTYLGDHLRLRVRTAWGEAVSKTSAAEVALSNGVPVRLSWDPARVRIFASRSGG